MKGKKALNGMWCKVEFKLSEYPLFVFPASISSPSSNSLGFNVGIYYSPTCCSGGLHRALCPAGGVEHMTALSQSPHCISLTAEIESKAVTFPKWIQSEPTTESMLRMLREQNLLFSSELEAGKMQPQKLLEALF